MSPVMSPVVREIPYGEADLARIDAGINAHAVAMGAPPYDAERVALAVDVGGAVVGYLTAKIVWGWLHIEMLWVEPAHQHRRLGSGLMESAETLARTRGLGGLYCWTHSWQAEGFYKKLGYEEFARFDDFPMGYQRIGLRKNL